VLKPFGRAQCKLRACRSSNPTEDSAAADRATGWGTRSTDIAPATCLTEWAFWGAPGCFSSTRFWGAFWGLSKHAVSDLSTQLNLHHCEGHASLMRPGQRMPSALGQRHALSSRPAGSRAGIEKKERRRGVQLCLPSALTSFSPHFREARSEGRVALAGRQGVRPWLLCKDWLPLLAFIESLKPETSHSRNY